MRASESAHMQHCNRACRLALTLCSLRLVVVLLRCRYSYYPMRLEVARMQIFNRELLPEEVALNFATLPENLIGVAHSIQAMNMAPVAMPPGGVFIGAFYAANWYSDDFWLYLAADAPNAFPTHVDARGDGYPDASVTKILFSPRSLRTAASGVLTVRMNMTVETGCMNFRTWIVGDTVHNRGLRVPNWTICVPSMQVVEDAASAYFTMTTPGIHAPCQSRSHACALRLLLDSRVTHECLFVLFVRCRAQG